jgi:hypothetical protein
MHLPAPQFIVTGLGAKDIRTYCHQLLVAQGDDSVVYDRDQPRGLDPSVPQVKYFIQHCFVCRPSNSTVSEDAGI